jgi:hypothetical protein
MRSFALIPLALLAGGCWTPGPGQFDPTRYPWDQPKPEDNYCVISLEQPSATGITIGGQNTVNSACSLRPNRR